MSLKPFNFGIVTKRVLPIKAFKFSSNQPMDLNRIIDLAIWGARENLLEEISFSDDDIVSWSPENAEDYKDKNSRLYNRLAELKAKLDGASIPVHSVTCDLSRAVVFAHGAFTNNDSKVRELARKKAERALEIGRFFNATLFVYQTDSDGFDSPFTVNWQEAWNRLANGLESISLYASSQKMTNYRGAVIAPSQSVNYLYGFLNTPSDALAIINGLIKDRSFWGIAPSSAQLTSQGWEKAPAQIANIAGAHRLAFLKVGGGTERSIHRAPHPILGTGNISETAQLFWLLARMNWKGAVEYDNLASISDAKTTHDDVTCKQFLTNNASALTAALMLAEHIKVNELAELTPSEADLMAAALLGKLDVDSIILRTIKNLPPAFETPQPRSAQQNGKQKQREDAPVQSAAKTMAQPPSKTMPPSAAKPARREDGIPREDGLAQSFAKTAHREDASAQSFAKPVQREDGGAQSVILTAASPVPISASMPPSTVSQSPSLAVHEEAPNQPAAVTVPMQQPPVPQAPALEVHEEEAAAQPAAITIHPPQSSVQQPSALEVREESVGQSVSITAPREESATQSIAIAAPREESATQSIAVTAPREESAIQPVSTTLAQSATKQAENHHQHVMAPLPPPAPLLEDDPVSQPSNENALPLILPDEKKPKPRGRKVVARGRKAMASSKKRTPRKKSPGDSK